MNVMSKRWLVLSISVFVLMTVATWSDAAFAQDGSCPVQGGRLRVAINADVSQLDPHKNPNQPSGQVLDLVYSTLVGLDEDMGIVPDLAASWEMPSDTEYVFTLREGVLFHHGRELTADDVKFSLDRLVDPATGSARRSDYAGIDSVEVLDKYVVKITMKEPSGAFLTQLADSSASIVAKELVEEHGDLLNVVVGSGPFRFVSHTPGQGVVLAKNVDYFIPGQPCVDTLEILPIAEESARVNALLAGNVDIINFVPPSMMGTLRSNSRVTVGSGTSGQFYFLSLNQNKPQFANEKVRQAIFHALDRDMLVLAALLGEGYALTGGPIPAWHPYGLKKPLYPAPDLARAQQLMAESGVGSFDATISVWSAQNFAVLAAELIQQQLAPLGIRIRIQQYGDWATYENTVFTNKQADMTIQGFGGNIDPDRWLYQRFITDGGSNLVDYSSREIDELLERGRAAVDPDERLAIYTELQQKLAASGPMAFLFNMSQPEAWRDHVKGFVHLPNLMLTSLKHTWVEGR